MWFLLISRLCTPNNLLTTKLSHAILQRPTDWQTRQNLVISPWWTLHAFNRVYRHVVRIVTVWWETDHCCKFTFHMSSNNFQKHVLAVIIYSSQCQFAIVFLEFLLRLSCCETERVLLLSCYAKLKKRTFTILRRRDRQTSWPACDILNQNSDMYWWFKRTREQHVFNLGGWVQLALSYLCCQVFVKYFQVGENLYHHYRIYKLNHYSC